MTSDVNIGLAFLAGFISFISPCVLPLVPAYMGYLSGRATNEVGKENRHRFGTFVHGLFFVLGFTIFFVGFGVLTAAASSVLTQFGIDIPTVITRLGGIAIILFGLYTMKALDPVFRWLLSFIKSWEDSGDKITPIVFTLFTVGVLFAYAVWAFGSEMPWSLAGGLLVLLLMAGIYRNALNKATSLGDFWYRAIQSTQFALATDTRQMNFQSKSGNGYASSVGMGVVFSAGWTPCIGPVYAAVLTLANESAAQGDSLLPAATMLTAYSLGLGIPFLMTALAFNQSVGLMNKLKRHMRTVELVSGVFLILVGVTILTGRLTEISARFGTEGQLGEISLRLEACTAGVADGHLRMGTYANCMSGEIEKIDDRFIAAVNKYPDADAITSRYVFDEVSNLEDIAVGLQVGNRAPDFSLKLLDGSSVALSDYRGQAVLLNFWATWCGPCRTEMPAFQNVHDRENARGFSVLAVDYMDSQEAVAEFAAELNLDFPIALDTTGNVNQQYAVNAYPTSYLIDGNGIIVSKHEGGLTVQSLLEELDQFDTVEVATETAVNLN